MTSKLAHNKTSQRVGRLAISGLMGVGGISTSHAEIIHVDWADRTFAHTSTIAPKKFLEVCARLKQGETIAWKFKGSAVTDFNLHYHVGKQVTYPKKRKGVASAAGKLAVTMDQDYCWMWTNKGGEPVNIIVNLKQ